MAPRGTAPSAALTGRRYPLDGRSIVASISPTRAASALPAGTTSVLAEVSRNGAPLPAITDDGAGTTACDVNDASAGCCRSGTGAVVAGAWHAPTAHMSRTAAVLRTEAIRFSVIGTR